MVCLNISLSIPDVVKKTIVNVARTEKIYQLWQAYAIFLCIEQAIFCQALDEFVQPGGIGCAVVGFENWSQVCQGNALVGGQGAQVIDDAPAKIATGAGKGFCLVGRFWFRDFA